MTRHLEYVAFCLSLFVGASLVMGDENIRTFPEGESEHHVRLLADAGGESALVVPVGGTRYGAYYHRGYRYGPRYQVYRYPYGSHYRRYYHQPYYRYSRPYGYYGPSRSYYYQRHYYRPYSFHYYGSGVQFGFSY